MQSNAVRQAALLYLIILLLQGSLAIDKHDFRTCAQTPFCREHRRAECSHEKYVLAADPIINPTNVTGTIIRIGTPDVSFPFSVAFHGEGVVHLLINETTAIDAPPRVQAAGVLNATIPAPVPISVVFRDSDHLIVGPPRTSARVRIGLHPFSVHVSHQGESLLSINRHGGLYMKPSTNTPAPSSFNGFQDPNPHGDTAVSLDVDYPDQFTLTGLPEHTDGLFLSHTLAGEPYRFYNTDAFRYETNSRMALYASFPVVNAISDSGHASTFLWMNPSETWVDVRQKPENNAQIRGRGSALSWVSETGLIDVFIAFGSTPAESSESLMSIMGAPTVPPLWSLGYHQSRWNYRDESDVRDVIGRFESHNLPLDTIWLDIEYTDGKRYFTWDEAKFPDPAQLQGDIRAAGRRLVTIVDPHIKVTGAQGVYPMWDAFEAAGAWIMDGATPILPAGEGGGGVDPEYSGDPEAEEGDPRGYIITTTDNDGDTDHNDISPSPPFIGDCWPGASQYPDFIDPDVKATWASFIANNITNTTLGDWTWLWNDMNEPSVFAGPEGVMPRHARHLSGVEHRAVHNLYGLHHAIATHAGLVARRPDERPFLLTRAAFPGVHRYAAVWTGDNTASWTHLGATVPMLLGLGATGTPWVGADVGGFFDDPSPEMLVRWYQVGTMMPFFRGHAHLDTKRREPWLFGDDITALIRNALHIRYSLLPLIYSEFIKAGQVGSPILRPLIYDFFDDRETHSIDTQATIGPLLFAPVVRPSATHIDVYLPNGSSWYQFSIRDELGQPLTGGQWHHLPVTLSTLPIFQKGGTVFWTKDTLRHTTVAMVRDPYTMRVALDDAVDPADRRAEGELAVMGSGPNDGVLATSVVIEASSSPSARFVLNNSPSGPSSGLGSLEVGRIVILGLKACSKIWVAGGEQLDFTLDEAAAMVTVRRPGVAIDEQWSILIK